MSRYLLVGLLLSVVTGRAFTSPRPFHSTLLQMDRMMAAAQNDSAKERTVLEVLERIGMGEAPSLTPAQSELLGIPSTSKTAMWLTASEVRAYAFEKIGDLALPESIPFLEGLTDEAFETDSSRRGWPTSQVALKRVLLAQISDSEERVAFLEKTITGLYDAGSRIAVIGWATDELCDRGVFRALPLIRASIQKKDSSIRGSEEIRFCEARMDVVSRNPDRIKAIASVLRVDSAGGYRRLTMWAILQLMQMKAPEAKKELLRFVNEVEAFPEGSAERRPVEFYRRYLRVMLANDLAGSKE